MSKQITASNTHLSQLRGRDDPWLIKASCKVGHQISELGVDVDTPEHTPLPFVHKFVEGQIFIAERVLDSFLQKRRLLNRLSSSDMRPDIHIICGDVDKEDITRAMANSWFRAVSANLKFDKMIGFPVSQRYNLLSPLQFEPERVQARFVYGLCHILYPVQEDMVEDSLK